MRAGTFLKAPARLAGLILALAALAGCEVPLEKDRLSHDGIVSRMVVEGPTASRFDGPRCGDARAEYGGKGAAFQRVSGTPPRGYRVGPGDALRLNIFGEEGMRDLTARVDAEGYIQVPIIPAEKVAGMTTRDIQARLQDAYRVEFNEPWVTVELARAESQPIYFLGEFRDPGVKYLEFATELIEALAMASGLEEDAYLPGARLIRDSHVCTVDLDALLKTGDFRQNVWMKPGDILFAPSREDMRVYILGAVASPQAVPFGADGRSLLEALAMAGGPDGARARLDEVRIIRSRSTLRGELLVVDVAGMLAGARLDYPLMPGDVVYVPRTPLASWNAAIGEILPSLQVIGGILTPIALIDGLQE